MNPAPLPQPAPFTCPNCGASLNEKPQLCPRCGARLDAASQSKRSLLAGLALTIGLLFFGAMGGCGGWFVISAFGPQDFELPARAFLIISVPSLIIGALGFWSCARAFRKK